MRYRGSSSAAAGVSGPSDSVFLPWELPCTFANTYAEKCVPSVKATLGNRSSKHVGYSHPKKRGTEAGGS